MAYLDLAERMSTAHQILLREPVGFTAREWQIIKLARNERLSSLRDDSEFVSFLRFVFGAERERPLANPRYEALRRMAVMSWHYGFNVHGSELEAFLEAGFSLDHYEALLAHIGAERSAPARRHH